MTDKTTLTNTDPIVAGRSWWEDRYGTDAGAAMAASANLVRTREILVTFMDAYLKEFEMDFTEYDIMIVIDRFGDGSLPLGKISDRVRRFVRHQTSMTNVVNRMIDRGLLSRRTDPDDGRVSLIELTPKGRRLLNKAQQTCARVQFGLGELSVAERETLSALLQRVRVAHGDISH